MYRTLNKLLLLSIALPATLATPTIPKTLTSHDPSRLAYENGIWIFYSTGADLTGWYTTNNGASWSPTPKALPSGIPSNVHAACPTNDGHDIWAPDLIWNPNSKLWNLYYSCADWNNGTYSAIGLVTSPTLNPSSAVWTNKGVVVAKSPSAAMYNAIDPGPFFDGSGNMWMVFGSGYGSTSATAINVISLDKSSGLRTGSSLSVVTTGSREGAYIHYHSPYYYLFFNTGKCCNGAASDYTIHVMRSSSPSTGYGSRRVFDDGLDRTGVHGPGHMGIVTDGGTDYYTYHYYNDAGTAVLGMGKISWSSDGWPVKA